MSRLSTPITPLLACLLLACQPVGGAEGETADASGSEGDGDGDPTTTTGDGDGDPTTTGGPTMNCDPSEGMPCPEGQKCTVLTTGGIPIYDCVPDDTGLLPFEPCTPAPTTGQDQCPDKHVCIGATPDASTGICMQLCGDDDDCDAELCVAPPLLQEIPVCAAICDPLGPLCPEQQDCQRVRGSNFVCQYPREDDNGTTAETCNIVLDAGCAEGFVCETGGIIPGCADQACCTALCDLTDANPCEAPMICGEIPLDPQPGLENVGACYVPQ
jgi:hypothetical protein